MKSKLIIPAIILTFLAGIFIGHSNSIGDKKEEVSFNISKGAFSAAPLEENKTKALINMNDQILILKADMEILKGKLTTVDEELKIAREDLSTVREKGTVNVLPPSLRVPDKPVPAENEQDAEVVFAEEQEARIATKRNYVNMRSGPGETYRVITRVYQNQNLSIIGEKNLWYKVRLNNGQIGWIASWIIKPINN